MKGKTITPTQLDNFVLGKNFNGYITDLNIFDSFLDHETMAKWTSCRSKRRGNVFAWNPVYCGFRAACLDHNPER